uniref:Maspardin n=2 Tax=Timema TaxID=61471 RepID=A0A7R9EVF3_9NEOP|nr:unnamed protein product [Timema bartmani]
MMSFVSDLSKSQEYLSFRSSIPLRKIVVDSDSSKGWKLYDSGPKSVKTPLVCLPPVSGTCDVFFKQILALNAKGFRVIAVSGFLAQKFAESTMNCPRVASLILCNTFTDTSVFSYSESAVVFWMLPSLVLKKMVMGNFTSGKVDPRIADSIDFMVERLESLTQQELASRLTLNCMTCYVEPQKIMSLPITIMDVFDEYALSNPVREEMYKCYPTAKLAHLKSGGNFPYLSRSDQVNLHLQIHLRTFEGTNLSASEQIQQNIP